MFALDFIYDGQYLSDYGFLICEFNGQDGTSFANPGSQITFEKVKRNNGYNYSLVGTQYNECITTEFDICKNPDFYNDLEITNDEYRDIMRWLNRKEFLKFCIVVEGGFDHETCYYMASFTVKKIYIRERLCGMRLTMETNSPFGHGSERSCTWTVSDTTKSYKIEDVSDEIGDTNINLKVTCATDGDLTITNTTTGQAMVVASCTSGEVITMDGDTQIISTSSEEHKILNDFNFNFLKISNTLSSRSNAITFSIPCTVIIKYTPIIKDMPR